MEFGYLPFLYVLREYEEEDRYEDCAYIRDFLLEKSAEYGFEYPVDYDKALDRVELALSNYGNGGNVWKKNFPHFVRDLRCLFDED